MDNKKSQSNKGPRYNFAWLYIILLGIIFYVLFYQNDSSTSKEVDYTTFKEYVNKGYAKNIAINKDDLTLDMYVNQNNIHDVFGTNSKVAGRNPSVKVEFGSLDKIEEFIDSEVESGHFTGDVSYTRKNDLFINILWQIGPIILIVVIWMFFIRRMGSGGVGSGIFSVGKSKAKLFEKDGKKISMKPWNANRLVFICNEVVGTLVYGRLAEKTNPVKNVDYQEVDGFKLISKYSLTNPLREITGGQAFVAPIIEDVDQIYVLDLSEAQEVDTSAEESDVSDEKITIWGKTYTKANFVVELNKIAGSSFDARTSDEDLIAAVNKLSEAKENNKADNQ